MNVTVRYFAAAAEAAGLEEESLEVDGETLESLTALLAQRYGAAMQKVIASGSFLIDEVVHRHPSTRLAPRIDVLPPFAGG